MRLAPDAIVGPTINVTGRRSAFVLFAQGDRMVRVDPATAHLLRRIAAHPGEYRDEAESIAELGDGSAEARLAFRELASLGVIQSESISRDTELESGSPRRHRPGHVHLFNPEQSRLFSRSPLNTRGFFAGLAVIVIGLVAAVAISIPRLGSDVEALWKYPLALIAVLALVVLSTVLHECGHAAAILRAGGRSSSIGLTAVPAPGMYAQIESVMILEKRLHRVIVYLSGPAITAFLTAAFLLIATLLDGADLGLPSAMASAAGWINFLLLIGNLVPWPGSDSNRAIAHWRSK